MLRKDSSFAKFMTNFVINKTAVSISFQLITLYLIFAFINTGIGGANVLLSFLLFSNFCVVIFILITGIVIKSDDKYAIDKWRDIYAKEELMKEKTRFIQLVFGIFLFINILL